MSKSFSALLARWWLALLAAAGALICIAVIFVQQMEIRGLKAAPEAGSWPAPAQETPAGGTDQPNRARDRADGARSEEAEMARLTARAEELAADVARLEKIEAENAQLRQQLAAAGGSALTPEEVEAVKAARERAGSIQCVNNLKQIALATRMWAMDDRDTTPATVLQMTNVMSTPKFLICPADTGRQAATNWGSFTPANCSYEYLAPSASENEPSRVLFRCPIHENLALIDGSVQMAKNHPDWVVQQDGKLYFYPSNR